MTVRIFDDEDLAALKRVLDSGDLSAIGGQAGRDFEAAFAAEMGVRRAYAVNSGMSALHSAVFAADAGAGDEVICDSMVQFGSAAVMYHNAVPVFADVRRDTHCIDPESVRERITERTKAIICTHLWGLPADMDPIMEIAEEHGLVVIEDNAHGLYAEYKGRLTGTLGHMAEFSFQMSKQLGLGDAGMATTMDERFEDNLWETILHSLFLILNPNRRHNYHIAFREIGRDAFVRHSPYELNGCFQVSILDHPGERIAERSIPNNQTANGYPSCPQNAHRLD